MPSSSKLVNTSEAFELRLVHYLGNHDATSPFVLECETSISNGDALHDDGQWICARGNLHFMSILDAIRVIQAQSRYLLLMKNRFG